MTAANILFASSTVTMLSLPKRHEGGDKYGDCLHKKPPYLQWDPHPVCFACTDVPKVEAAMIDFVHGGAPTCRYCRRIPKDVRKHWIDSVRDYMGMDPWTGETAEFLEVREGVARLDMQATPPSDGRRASGSGLSSRRTAAGPELTPQGASYYPPSRGYLAASTGEPAPRGAGHGSSRDGETLSSGSQDSPLPPSGVSARTNSRTVAEEPSLLNFAKDNPKDIWGSGDPDVIVEDEFEMEEDEEEERESRDWKGTANPPSADEASEKVISIFKEVFQRAYSSGCYKAQAVEQPSLPMGSLSTGKRATKSNFLPAYPPVEHWFKLAEKMPNLEPHKEVTKLGGTIIPVAVEGLHHERWQIPLVENSLKPEGWRGRKHGQYSSLPQFAHYTGDTMLREAWLSNLRAVNALSCVGMINDYLKCMSDPTNLELHGEALTAAGVDLESLRIGMELPGVRDVLSEFSQACEAMGVLVLNASLSVGRGCAAATLGRRKLWIDGLGYDQQGVERFAKCSTAGNQTLCGCTPDNIERMVQEQTNKDTVARALASCRKSTPAATSSTARGRGGSSFAAINSAKLQLAWSKGIPVPGRGRGEGGKYGKTTAKQPGSQTPAMGQASESESPAAKKAKKQ